MKKSSIHFSPVASHSEAHNKREVQPDYLIPGDDSIPKNFCSSKESIESRLENIKALYVEKVGQKWQSQMTPIKEAVVVLDKNSFRTDKGFEVEEAVRRINSLNAHFKTRYGIKMFQVYIHFDEGKKVSQGSILPVFERNIHAHLIFDWQNKENGRMAKLGKKEMSEIQTMVAKELGLERGVVNSKAERLEHREYREKMQQLDEELQKKKTKFKLLTDHVSNLKTRREELTKIWQT